MRRRQFLATSSAAALVGASYMRSVTAHDPAPASATGRPIRIVMGGYGPPTTSFSRGLKLIGDRLEEKFAGDVEINYVYNVLELGYAGGDLRWLVSDGVFAMAYLTMTGGVPELEIATLPFLFPDTTSARIAMDGELGQRIIAGVEAENNYRVLGFFENGFRHISNNVRPVVSPTDLSGMDIRTLGSASLVRTFELMGANPKPMPLTIALKQIQEGTLAGQENPFANTVTYNIYPHQKFHTMTMHTYLSRPIFVHRPSFEAWPAEIRSEIQAAAREAITFQRELHDQEETEAARTIRDSGGEIVELSADQRAAFVAAVAPIYDEARAKFSPEQLKLVGL